MGVIFAIVAMVALVSLAKYLEKIQREATAQKRTGRKPFEARSRGAPDRHGRGGEGSVPPKVFYGRPAAPRPDPRALRHGEGEVRGRGVRAPGIAAPGVPLATALARESRSWRPSAPPGVPHPGGVQPARRAAPHPGQPAAAHIPAAREEARRGAPEAEPVSELYPVKSHSLGQRKVSSLRGRELEVTLQVRSAVAERAAPVGGYVGDLLRREHLGRAFVLSEIFGPPKALR